MFRFDLKACKRYAFFNNRSKCPLRTFIKKRFL